MIKKNQENEYKKVSIKNCGCYYFDDIINFEDFDFENIFLDKKLNENFFICDLSQKTLVGAKSLCIKFDKLDRLLEFMMEVDIQYQLVLKNMMPFLIGLDIL